MRKCLNPKAILYFRSSLAELSELPYISKFLIMPRHALSIFFATCIRALGSLIKLASQTRIKRAPTAALRCN
jgi:hypothetical protein